MRVLGNERAWTAVMKHVCGSDTKYKPLVVSGPTGCGKTWGVRAVLRAAGYRLLELDGADAETTDQLVGWIKRVRKLKVLQGATAVFLDDFEGFTKDARKRAVQAMATDDPVCTPLIITCAQARDPEMKDLQALAGVRLYTPPEGVVRAWFEKRFTATAVKRVRELCATGDLRRVRLALEWRAAPARAVTEATQAAEECEARGQVQAAKAERARAAALRALQAKLEKWDGHGTASSAVVGNNANKDTTTANNKHNGSNSNNAFDAARALMLKRCAADVWARDAEERDVALVRHHLAAHVDDDVGVLAHAYDAFSEVDTQYPQRFELREAHAHYARVACATAVRVTSRARDVGALPPPPRMEVPVEPENPACRRWTRAEWRDVPALLRGP